MIFNFLWSEFVFHIIYFEAIITDRYNNSLVVCVCLLDFAKLKPRSQLL